MGKHKFPSIIEVVDLPKYEDDRGFLSSFGVDLKGSFKEDRYSVSKKDVLRGLHGDSRVDKFIVVLQGEVEFFATPYLRSNPNFGVQTFLKLSGNTPKAIYLPKGYVNGHLCLSESCVFFYKWSDYYNGPEAQVSVRYNDPSLSIPWSVRSPILSMRDQTCETSFEELSKEYE